MEKCDNLLFLYKVHFGLVPNWILAKRKICYDDYTFNKHTGNYELLKYLEGCEVWAFTHT